MRGLDGAGSAHRHAPALNTELPREGFQFLYRRQASALEVLAVDGTRQEELLPEAHATHAAAFYQLGFEIFANHQLR